MPVWKDVARKKKAERSEAIAKAAKLLGDSDVACSDDARYLRASAVEIVRNIEQGRWTSLVVVSAFIHQAIRSHQKTNCLTEILFEQALKEAAEHDAEFSSTNYLRGPLHGVPMTVKDCFEVEGYDTSVGYTQWTNSPSTRNAQLVKQCRSLGAIIIAKTNIPQTMLSFECNNPVFGRTKNPWGDAFTCGGSSGGEAANLAMNGAALGIGTDIGGSLRIPAAYCGIYALKPGLGRITRAGVRTTCPGFESITFVAGPMARSSEDIELMCKHLMGLSGAPGESLPKILYTEPRMPDRLRFGYYTSDRFVKASPACRRAVMETVEALRKQGHECIEFSPDLAIEAMFLFVALTSSDGYKTLLKPVGPDPLDDSLFLLTLGPKLPGFIRRVVVWILQNVFGDEAYATVFSASRVKSTEELFALNAQRDALRRRWCEEIWNKHQFDGVISPVQASPAIPLGAAKTLAPLAAATILYNVLDIPVGIVPVTRVDPARDQLTEEWKNAPDHGSKMLERELYYMKDAVYNPEKMSGLPVAIQIAGRNYEEEKVVAMMKVIDDALGRRSFGLKAS